LIRRWINKAVDGDEWEQEQTLFNPEPGCRGTEEVDLTVGAATNR
jgi:hypothetical protein